MATLRIGSRGSQLALWQAKHVARLLQENGHATDIQIISTTGDKILDVALSLVGTKGMFTKEIEEALADNKIDLAVHSLKDVPTELPCGFALAAILSREDPADAFLSTRFASLDLLPQGAKVGTSSLRRQAQLRALRKDLDIQPLRGNVDTRMRKLESGEYDAIILAVAGLNRLGRKDAIRQVLPIEMMCPAAGQGALAVEVRSDDSSTRELLAFLDDADARAATDCERTLLNALGGGCQVPIGAYARIAQKQIDLSAVVARPDGSEILRVQKSGNDPIDLGNIAGQQLLMMGATLILNDVYSSGSHLPEQP